MQAVVVTTVTSSAYYHTLTADYISVCSKALAATMSLKGTRIFPLMMDGHILIKVQQSALISGLELNSVFAVRFWLTVASWHFMRPNVKSTNGLTQVVHVL